MVGQASTGLCQTGLTGVETGSTEGAPQYHTRVLQFDPSYSRYSCTVGYTAWERGITFVIH